MTHPGRSPRRRILLTAGLIVLGLLLMAELAFTDVFSLHGLLTERP